ncbi:16129_t:CDS:2 [Funneliformis caledonium]|uniref:16129_t:CDS:1 n=1 Tax=Funneliformis caledonium TaxID=1117310 RepID=A0A9N8W2B9_9GLOM|nr:16129_t:CDS:2 [Funneliformis caledonium]
MTEESTSQAFYNMFMEAKETEETNEFKGLRDKFLSLFSSKNTFIKFVYQLIKSNNLSNLINSKNLSDTKALQDLFHSKNLSDVKSLQDLMNIKSISDEKFIRDLIYSSFLGKDKKKLISIFLEEYKKLKVTFSNEIKEILQKDSLIQKLSHHLKEEFEQEKRNIESREFQSLCNVIEEKYQNNGTLRMNILNITGTEELCFIEQDCRARIYNLITKQFRPAVCSFPSNTVNVLSSSDGSCTVAFVKEKLEYNNPNSENNSVDANNKEISRAYVYFCTKFGGSVNKVVDLPPNLQSLEILQFTCINNLQTHLMSIDLKNG